MKELTAGVHFRLPIELREKLRILKEDRDINISAVMRKLLINYVNEQFKEA